MNSARIKINDEVVVNRGAHKGSVGRVIKIHRLPSRRRGGAPEIYVSVQGVNIRRHHRRPTQRNQEGGIIEQERPLHISNVSYVAARSKDAVTHSRIGFRIRDGIKYRVIKATNTEIKEVR